MMPTLPVVERFHSIQGEGAHVGKSAFFIRLANCKVGCSWCDTKESWDATKHPNLSVKSLALEAKNAFSNGAAFVVITGGEPLHHNLDQLCNELKIQTMTKGKTTMPIHLETSGVNDLSGNPTWITLSPKRHALPCGELLRKCHELKLIIHEKEDLIFAEKMAIAARENRPEPTGSEKQRKDPPLLFLQAGWQSIIAQELTFNYVRSHPEWRLSMQTHKWLGVS